MSLNLILTFFFFIFGTIVGSFLNVLVLRYNTGRSVITGRSFCFSCGKTLSWYELIPLFSFIYQRGRCHKCRSKISWQYPIVEFLSGLLFVFVYLKFSLLNGLYLYIPGTILGLIICSILLAITVYDIRQKIIPDGLLVTLGVVAIVNLFLPPIFSFENIAAGFILALPLFLISFLSKGRLMGMGDPKLVLVLGWLLGLFSGLSAVVLAFWIGAIYGVVLMILSRINLLKNKVTRTTEVPFAPFLILGFLLVYFLNISVFNLANLVI